jgi:hypothetical protein
LNEKRPDTVLATLSNVMVAVPEAEANPAELVEDVAE